MTRGARLPVEAFEQGGGPSVCVLSGKPTEHRFELTATRRDTPSWLLFVGVIPYVVARLTSKRAHGSLPLTEDVERLLAARRIKARSIAIPCAVVIVLGVLALSQLPGLAVILIIAPCSFAVTVLILNRQRSPLSPVHLDPEGRWVVIPHAAEEYAAALEGQPGSVVADVADLPELAVPPTEHDRPPSDVGEEDPAAEAGH